MYLDEAVAHQASWIVRLFVEVDQYAHVSPRHIGESPLRPRVGAAEHPVVYPRTAICQAE